MPRLVCALGAALLLAAPAFGASITRHATTASYRLTLAVGPTEAMYTAAEVKAKHPKSGEVMVGDAMSTGGMSMKGVNRHLEVHLVSRKTGKVVADAKPAIVLDDESGMGMGMNEKVNAMAMEGIGAGVADLHYGDNVKLTAGHVYKVVVTVWGEKATFSFKA